MTTTTNSLSAELRERAGKGAARAVRRAGRVPGVVYGAKQTPVLISLDPKELGRALGRPGFFATLFDLAVGGDSQRVLPRDVQFDPVTDKPVHIDLMRVARDSLVVVQVPVEFINEAKSPGIKRGGVLNIVRHEIEMRCAVDSIPNKITVDLDGLDIGDSVHISMVTLPEGVTPTIADRDFTIASVAAPSAVRAEALEAQEAAAAAAAVPEEPTPETPAVPGAAPAAAPAPGTTPQPTGGEKSS